MMENWKKNESEAHWSHKRQQFNQNKIYYLGARASYQVLIVKYIKTKNTQIRVQNLVTNKLFKSHNARL